MFVPTERTQTKLRQIAHDLFCTEDCPGSDLEWARACNRASVQILGLMMPTLSDEMFPAVREDERQRIVDRMGRIPSGFLGCPGGHECACGSEVLDQAFRVVEEPKGAATPDPGQVTSGVRDLW